MNVLQLGPEDWSKQLTIPDQLTWQYNMFPSKKINRYQVVLITGPVSLTDQQWKNLTWKVNPYDVYYVAGVNQVLSPSGRYFLKSRAAQMIKDPLQKFVNRLPNTNFFGQTGGRISPQNFVLNRRICNQIHFRDSGHLELNVKTNDWQVVANLRNSPFVDPERRLKLWLEYQTNDIDVRFRVMDLSKMPKFYLSPGIQINEPFVVPTEITSRFQFIGVAIEVRGQGKITLGNFHYRWWRDGAGEFLAGGRTIVNKTNRRDLDYLFSPGDLKPPLQVYFASYHEKEGFEAFPMFNNMHTPFILFSDNRLIGGQFYIGDGFNERIKEIIRDYLDQLGFTSDQLVMTGISMGSYPAIRYGSELQAHAVVVAKPLLNLGFIARRGRLQRPYEFQTSYDMLKTLAGDTDNEDLISYDHDFWNVFTQNNFSKTSFFLAHMFNDDYDNRSVPNLVEMSHSEATKQIVRRGYPGRHNDNNSAMIHNFLNWLHQIHVEDFGRKE